MHRGPNTCRQAAVVLTQHKQTTTRANGHARPTHKPRTRKGRQDNAASGTLQRRETAMHDAGASNHMAGELCLHRGPPAGQQQTERQRWRCGRPARPAGAACMRGLAVPTMPKRTAAGDGVSLRPGWVGEAGRRARTTAPPASEGRCRCRQGRRCDLPRTPLNVRAGRRR